MLIPSTDTRDMLQLLKRILVVYTFAEFLKVPTLFFLSFLHSQKKNARNTRLSAYSKIANWSCEGPIFCILTW